MWVDDDSDNKIYAYNLATKERDSGREFNTLADAGNTDTHRHLVRRRDHVGARRR